jgi:hydrophobe/amphiphile efflux-1 (HAE1) family protein
LSISTPFIHRPVGTTLLTIAIALAGILAYRFLPVAPLPQVDSPTISVSANLPGASPETMASAVATPLERQFGRIASVTEMTSSSQLGSTSVTLQFDLSRNIDAAGRDVQAAINAARGQLPTNLPGNPTYRKVNPADPPILIIALSSTLYSRGQMYDLASSVLAQRLSQVPGVGQVFVGGGALPAVRVDVNPTTLNQAGLGLEDVRKVLEAANSNLPKGEVDNRVRTVALGTTDQLLLAQQYRPLIVTYKNGAPIRVSDIATVTDSVEDIRTAGTSNGKPAVVMFVFRQPGANIIQTVDDVLDLVPQMQAEIPAAMHLSVVMDRTTSIRASVRDTEFSLMISICLVVLVVFVFLRDVRSTFIPGVAVPVSLIGTFGVMYLAGYSIDNLSLMALTIATGFVVDDAIVVIENVTRHLEQGTPTLQATLIGAKEIGFTVLSMSTSLVAVFIPILLMGGIVGRLFREFAVTLSVAIAMSMVISLTTTPMMCALLLRPKSEQRHGRIYAFSERVFNGLLGFYERTLGIALRHPLAMILATALTVVFTVYLYVIIPKGFFPQQDSGRISGRIQADQDTSFQSMNKMLTQFTDAVLQNPDVDSVTASCGGGRGSQNTAMMFISLKPLGVRKHSADQVITTLVRSTAHIPGATLYMQAFQDVSAGGRQSNAQFQYTLQDDDLDELLAWSPKLVAQLRKDPTLTQVNSDQQTSGLLANLDIDRTKAARLGVSAEAIDNVLYDAFGQRQVSTMYKAINQYHVVMEALPALLQSPDSLKNIYVQSTGGQQVPLSAVTKYDASTTPLTVNHQGQFPAVTISFNLPPGKSLSDAVIAVNNAERAINMPGSVRGAFAGTAQLFQSSLSSQPILVTAAILAVYVVLGMLYESLVHPLTILSTIPSAGVGALLALLITGTQLDVIGLIGIILLIGIVKKNAIMMIDFAIDQERNHHKKASAAIYEACMLRFRPIMMTTMAALLGGLPLALGRGTGSELRRPLGIAIVGGLILSQMLTLYTTPIVYLYLDRFRIWSRNSLRGKTGIVAPHPA